MDLQNTGEKLEILYTDPDILVCIKPARVLSTDEPGGLPSLVRTALGNEKADVRTVHRLDRVVSGIMVLARNAKAASELSRQIREDAFEKEYLAVVHGKPEADAGTFTDLLYRDKARRMTMVASAPAKGVQEAILDYTVLNRTEEMSRVKVLLKTGRTHQIRVQFSSRGTPLMGDKKYGFGEDCDVALWSYQIAFHHPKTGEYMTFCKEPPSVFPWTEV